MRSSGLFATTLLLATSSAQYFSYDDFSDDFNLNARDEQYGLDMDDLLELYSREADMDIEADLFGFDTRNEEIAAGPGKETMVSIQDTICVVNKKIESGGKCKGQKAVGIVKAQAKLPPNTSLTVSVSGGTK